MRPVSFFRELVIATQLYRQLSKFFKIHKSCKRLISVHQITLRTQLYSLINGAPLKNASEHSMNADHWPVFSLCLPYVTWFQGRQLLGIRFPLTVSKSQQNGKLKFNIITLWNLKAFEGCSEQAEFSDLRVQPNLEKHFPDWIWIIAFWTIQCLPLCS